MKKEKIKDAINEKTVSLSKTGKKIAPDFDKEDIHNFRVTVKTLRSFLRLLRSQPHRRGLKITKKFKRIYHIAGAIRDAQLEIEQMRNEHATLPAYMDQLFTQLDMQKKEWHKHYSGKVTDKLKKQLAGSSYKPADKNAIADFLNTQLRTIETIINMPAPTDDQVHTMRKRVKDILYIAKFLSEKKWKEVYSEVTGIPEKELEELADEIGDYNDQRIILGHLSSFAGGEILDEEQNSIKIMIDEKGARLHIQKQRIISIVRGLMHPAERNEKAHLLHHT